jgi:hypothetical protein
MKTYSFIIFTICCTLIGCREPKFNRSDFIGKWSSLDSSKIVFYPNGTCSLSKLNYYKINNVNRKVDDKLNTKGTWKLIYEYESGIPNGISTGVGISYESPEGIENGGGKIDFFISGQGILENNPPYYLFIWDGDPDNVEKYKFEKE